MTFSVLKSMDVNDLRTVTFFRGEKSCAKRLSITKFGTIRFQPSVTPRDLH